MSLDLRSFVDAIMGAVNAVIDAATRVFYTLYELFMREVGGPSGLASLMQTFVFGILLNYALKLVGVDLGKLLSQLFNRLDQYASRWF